MSNFVCVRGGNFLTETEFSSHIHLASKVENLGVFLGAGASKRAGGHLVREVWTNFEKEYKDSADWLKDECFIQLKDDLDPETVDIEATLDCLTIADMEWTRKLPEGADLEALHAHRDNLYRSIIKASLLENELWTKPFKRATSEFLHHHRLLLIRLISTRHPGQSSPSIFTVNYDFAIEWAAESLGIHTTNGFTGLHHRTFSPQSFDLAFRNTQARGEARFGTYHINLVKMHGSLSWLSTKGQILEISSELWRKKANQFLKNEDQTWPGFLVMPTGAKYIQTVGFLYGELNRRFSEFMSRTNCCLFVNGYSFADDHINKIILASLQNPTLHLILYVPELPNKIDSFETWKNKISNPWIKAVVNSQLPQVTVVGSSSRAYFEKFVLDLPAPALYDEHDLRIQKFIHLLETDTSTTIKTDF